jgi:hypothetical protein
LYCIKLTNSMELSTTPEIPTCLDTRQFPSSLLNPKVQYRIHKSSPPAPVLSQTNSVHITPSHLYKIHANIIQPPTSWSSQWPPSLWLSHQQPIRVPLLPHSCYMPRPCHPPRLNYSNNTWRRVQIMKLFIMQFSPFSCHLIFLRSKYPQIVLYLYAKKSCDDLWTSNDSIGLKLWKSFEKRCRKVVPVRSMTKKHWIYVFLTSALLGGEWSASRPCRFTPKERAPVTHWIGGWVGPRAGTSDMSRWQFLTLPGLELRPFGPSACRQSLYRLNYRGSCNQ